jgi:general nucleoside transport system permease protein
MDWNDIAGLMQAALIAATPIALGSYAGLFSERSGIINIAIEGMMLMAAMSAAFVSAYTDSLFLGIIAGLGSGALMAAIHAVVSIRFKTDQILSGTVINFLAAGLTGHIYQIYLVGERFPGPAGTFPRVFVALERMAENLPVLGPPIVNLLDALQNNDTVGRLFFQYQPVVYVMIILTFLIHYVLFYTPWGLRTRAVGEHPKAADTVGINVYRIRYANVIIGGLMAGLAGIWFTLERVGSFSIGMTSGRGFIALAALIFGRWTPFGAFGAALLFGLASALQIRFQTVRPDIPAEFLQMLPYLLTIIVAAIARPVPPAAVGKPYEKG